MMYPYPSFGFPSFRKPYYYYAPYHYLHKQENFNIKNKKNPSFPSVSHKKTPDNLSYSSFSSQKGQKTEKNTKNEKTEFEDTNSDECFEIFGLKLHFDDLLIIALLFFLYKEDVKDIYLYISLILLLLS